MAEPFTRDHVLKLLSDGESTSVSTSRAKAHLGRGDEYLDLDHLQHGVQRAEGAVNGLDHVLPRKAINEDTWRRILRELKAAHL